MRKSVLIIENDTDTMEVVASLVTELDLNPICVGEAIDASLIDKLNPNLILLDHWLDDTFGGDLCRELKSNPLTQHIPIVMMSAAIEVKSQAKKAGADAFVPKPFDIENLENAITRLIK